MEAHFERFMVTVRARQHEIEKACMGILQRYFELDRLRRETSGQWRLDRQVRRFSRREMLRDCRNRYRRWRLKKRDRIKPSKRPIVGERGVYGMPRLRHPKRVVRIQAAP